MFPFVFVAMQDIDSVSLTTKCDDAKELANTAGVKLVREGVASIEAGPMKIIKAYKQEIEDFVSITVSILTE